MWLSENVCRVGKRLSGGHYDHNLPIEGLDGSVLREKLLPGGISVAQDASIERMARLVLASFPTKKKHFQFSIRKTYSGHGGKNISDAASDQNCRNYGRQLISICVKF